MAKVLVQTRMEKKLHSDFKDLARAEMISLAALLRRLAARAVEEHQRRAR